MTGKVSQRIVNEMIRITLKGKKTIKGTIRGLIPDYFLYHWLLPFRDSLKFELIYFRYWLNNRHQIKSRKTVVFISGESDTPGHNYRVERYMLSLRGLGVATEWFTPGVIYGNTRVIDSCNLLVIWRLPMDNYLKSVIERAINRNISIVFDLDDYIFDPALAEPEIADAIRFQKLDKDQIKKLFGNYAKVMLLSNVLTCPTNFLAEEMKRYEKPVFVLPNGYDIETLMHSYHLIHSSDKENDEIRIGYACGSKTHQKDFALVVKSMVRIFNEFPSVRLVIFGDALHIGEFPELGPFINRIESRKMVPFKELQEEIARFDINIAPLRLNPFNEAKSELKYFEAALLMIPTVASPTSPFTNIIDHGENGFLAANEIDWYENLRKLITDPILRKTMGKKANQHVLWNFGPEQRILSTGEYLISSQMEFRENINNYNLRKNALKFRSHEKNYLPALQKEYPAVVDYEVVSEFRNGRQSLAGVVIPVYNYEQYILKALDSVKGQTLEDIDLVVIDDCSTDGSLKKVLDWVSTHHNRFNNCAVLKNRINSRLSAARNTGYDYINTVWVMQLDADNELLPVCMEECLNSIQGTGAALVYPHLELFGEDKEYIFKSYESMRLSIAEWDPESLAKYNYIDAMAMVSKAAWASVGGYDISMIHGLEDYDLWLRFVEQGFFGIHIPKVLARYRVHKSSMLRTHTEEHYNDIRRGLEKRHPWIIKEQLP